ncbi:MAG: hypothetical protein LBC64_06375 [Fibromonadaceae bacterium]|jgi:uncharacterized protein YqeY|nr:hypothetical protein [Fibromonadaceae bacterium]
MILIFRALTAIFTVFTVLFAQDEPNQEIYSKVVLACEENKAVKTVLAQMAKKNEKATDAYDKSERNEKAKYERNASEIDIVSTEGPKVLKAYADCIKAKLQGKEFRNQGNKLIAKISVTNDGRIVHNSTSTTERPVKKGKATQVGNPTITQGKSLWCEDEMNKCLQATIVIEQK